MKLLKLNISGVRGLVGQTITPELVIDFASAFGTMIPAGAVLVGRDSRRSGPMVQEAVMSALLSTGHEVINLGISPTPVIQFLVRQHRAAGAVSITAGHNPAGWNALNFINSQGPYLNEFQGSELLDIYHLGRFAHQKLKKSPAVVSEVNPEEVYFSWLKTRLRTAEISRSRFKVVVDPCNGAGARLVNKFFATLSCELVAVNNEPSGYFPHDPEPRPRNAGEVASLVRATGANLGFLLNSDVSRVSLVTETGETLSEEYTLPVVAGYYLERQPGAVVTNLSTSRMIEEVAGRFQVPVLRTRVGQSALVQTMLQEGAALAGEGSGGLALADFQPAFDGFVVMGLILEMMAVRQKKLSELVKALPRYHIVKDKLICPPHRLHSLVAETRKLYPRAEINSLDGLHFTLKDTWVHVRASSTEPLIRIIAESASSARAQLEVDKVVAFLNRLLG
ncbi:MAG: phosphoglucosamine mutase [Candidatus Aminicenantes bacterium]|nr:phosphoglucosamine mutase [Candidatus Aminicenantes bacterium]